MDWSLFDGLNDFWCVCLWSELLFFDEMWWVRVLFYVYVWVEGGVWVSGVDVVCGFNQIFEMCWCVVWLFGEIDLLLMLINQVEVFFVDWVLLLNDLQWLFEYIVFIVLWNMGEQFVFLINCGFMVVGMLIGL